MATLRELAATAEATLQTSPHPKRARQDAEALLMHLLHQDRAWLLAHWDEEATSSRADYDALVVRRLIGEPLQYITGESDFFGLPFSVGPGVLIPRPETEHLVEEVIRLAGELGQAEARIADIGTGSGIIAVALANALPSTHITAIDCSAQALTIARDNAERNHVQQRIEFIESDLLDTLTDQTFSIIASNPPYVPLSDHDSLAVEVRDHEPHSALFAGDDGLELYRRLIPDAVRHLLPGGWLVLEIGFGQREAVQELLLASGYSGIQFIEDYQSIPRVAVGRRA